jgi:5-oxoprolinase (ATP-hydrolysing) subunit B
VRLLPYGPRALLAEFESLAEVMAAATQWRSASLPGVEEIVPAARTVLVVHDGRLDPALLAAADSGEAPATGVLVTVPVRYDGDDLEEVARATGLSVAEVVRAHTAPTYTVAFCGFMPGFSYLVGLDPRLHLPRRPTPRTRVPAGAVAIAGEYSGVYPTASPGGWRLIGRTPLRLFDARREPMSLLGIGDLVYFVPAAWT